MGGGKKEKREGDVEGEFDVVLGVMQPSFGSAHEFLSSESLRGKTQGDGFSLSKSQWTSGQHKILLGLHRLHPHFSLIKLMIVSAVFSFTLSVMHGIEVIIPRNPIFL